MLILIPFTFTCSRVEDDHFCVKIGNRYWEKNKDQLKEVFGSGYDFYTSEFIKRK